MLRERQMTMEVKYFFTFFFQKKDDLPLYACFLDSIGKHMNATSFIFFTTKLLKFLSRAFQRSLRLFFNALKEIFTKGGLRTKQKRAVIFAVKVGLLCLITANLHWFNSRSDKFNFSIIHWKSWFIYSADLKF